MVTFWQPQHANWSGTVDPETASWTLCFHLSLDYDNYNIIVVLLVILGKKLHRPDVMLSRHVPGCTGG